MTVQSAEPDSTSQFNVPATKLLQRIALVTGIVSLISYPVLAFIMTRLLPSSDRMIALHVLDAAPYGLALSIAAAGVAQQINYRNRAKRDPEISNSDYITGAVIGSIIWTVSTLVSIPLTTVALILSAFLLS
jgi:hypothetical protein